MTPANQRNNGSSDHCTATYATSRTIETASPFGLFEYRFLPYPKAPLHGADDHSLANFHMTPQCGTKVDVFILTKSKDPRYLVSSVA